MRKFKIDDDTIEVEDDVMEFIKTMLKEDTELLELLR